MRAHKIHPPAELAASDLIAFDHPYYCSGSNHYSNEPRSSYETLADFLDDFEETDVDMNLCWRWDMKPKDEDDLSQGHYAQVFLMLQRKGIFKPCEIATVRPEHLPRFRTYLEKHWKTLQALWAPISTANTEASQEAGEMKP